MKPSEITRALETLIQAKRPAMIWSNPGMGKSRIMQQTAKRLGRKLFDLRLTGRDVGDFIGLPTVQDGMTAFARPRLLPTEADGPSILFLDEINRANQMMLNAALQMVLDHRIGEHELPADCVVMAAGNPETDPGVIRMSCAMKLRFVHLNLAVDRDDWMKWAIEAGIEPVVIAFHRFRDDLLHVYDPKALTSPNPRGWEFVSEICSQNPDPALEHEIFTGVLGEATAVEFSGFRRLYANLPQIDAILLDPLKTRVPAEPNVRFAVAAALSRRASATNFGRVLQYLERMPIEFNVLAVKMAVGRANGALSATPEFTRWAIAHADVTF
ncbi:AAA family ATPase [Nevskia soli]|uniref:AAA family ATPase n=1 Tax=Nevskia soli TaxID=418856 RepID=UPI0015D8B64B|nr:MoxR family ATPase [Nevskia soli]